MGTGHAHQTTFGTSGDGFQDYNRNETTGEGFVTVNETQHAVLLLPGRQSPQPTRTLAYLGTSITGDNSLSQKELSR